VTERSEVRAPTATVVTRPSSAVRPILAEMRPRQWAKNLLVVAAPAGAEVLTELDTWWRLTLAFASFCAASSAIYVLNDLADIEADRRHPTKCTRPLAAGLISVATGWVMAVVLGVVAFALAVATTEWDFVAVLALYVVTTIAYSFWLKHVAILDLVIVASGFLLRAIGGAVVVNVVVSSWFLIVTGFGSLFVVTGKRLAELEELGEEAPNVRPTLDHYTVPFLRGLRGHRRRVLHLQLRQGGARWSGCRVVPAVRHPGRHRPAPLRARRRGGGRRHAGGPVPARPLAAADGHHLGGAVRRGAHPCLSGAC